MDPVDCVAEDKKDLSLELLKGRCRQCGGEGQPTRMVIEVPDGLHDALRVQRRSGFEFHGFPADAMPTIERLYPHIAAVMKVRLQDEEGRDGGGEGGG